VVAIRRDDSGRVRIAAADRRFLLLLDKTSLSDDLYDAVQGALASTDRCELINSGGTDDPLANGVRAPLATQGATPSGKAHSSKVPSAKTLASSVTITLNCSSVRSVFMRLTRAQVTTTLASSPGVLWSKTR
jgi:hypothetical protein